MIGRIRYRGIAGETFRNVHAAPGRSALAVAIAGILGAAVVVLSWLDLGDIESAWEEQVIAGAYAFSITTTDQTFLDATRCHELETIKGVRAAGAVLSVMTVYPATSPRTPYLVINATPGYTSIAFPSADGSTLASAAAGSTVTSNLGLISGAEFAYRVSPEAALSTVEIDLAVASPARFEVADGAIVLSRAPVGAVSECIVEAWPGSERAVESALSGWFPMTSTVAKVVARGEQMTRDVDSELRLRLSQWTPYVAVLLIGGFHLLEWWARRQEFALYRMLGVTTGQTFTMLALEILTKALVPVSLGAFLAIMVLSPSLSAMIAAGIARDLATVELCLFALPAIGSFVILRLSTFDAIKGR